jgi:hypothetical protein
VLERVESLQDGETRVAPGRAEAADQGAIVGIAHRRIMTRLEAPVLSRS